jgi:UDP-N-acetylglucosamine 2-epimerase
LEVFKIRPDFDLNVMEPDQMLSHLTAHLLESLDPIVVETKPAWILAEGDTTTVLVAGLVSYYRQVQFGHVEAGLRTGNKYRPYPEEINRRIADQLADAFFAPTPRNKEALIREGVPEERILVSGNTVVDALLDAVEQPYDWEAGPLSIIANDQKLVLITAHRRESFGRPLAEICLAVKELADQFADDGYHFVYPVHLNPNVRKPVEEILSNIPNVNLIEPLDYLSMVQLMKRSTLILTDSGGIQEEAPSLGVPVLVMRNVTERPEGIEAGVARVVGTNRDGIVKEATMLLTDQFARNSMVSRANPYGDGKAATRIVEFLLQRSNKADSP